MLKRFLFILLFFSLATGNLQVATSSFDQTLEEIQLIPSYKPQSNKTHSSKLKSFKNWIKDNPKKFALITIATATAIALIGFGTHKYVNKTKSKIKESTHTEKPKVQQEIQGVSTAQTINTSQDNPLAEKPKSEKSAIPIEAKSVKTQPTEHSKTSTIQTSAEKEPISSNTKIKIHEKQNEILTQKGRIKDYKNMQMSTDDLEKHLSLNQKHLELLNNNNLTEEERFILDNLNKENEELRNYILANTTESLTNANLSKILLEAPVMESELKAYSMQNLSGTKELYKLQEELYKLQARHLKTNTEKAIEKKLKKLITTNQIQAQPLKKHHPKKGKTVHFAANIKRKEITKDTKCLKDVSEITLPLN